MKHTERRALVLLHGERVGTLVEREDGMCVFGYDPAWIARPDPQPISFSMPVRTAVYESRGLHPFFLGLLPEGWNRNAAVRSLGLHPDDDVGLLLATGEDCIGAVDVIAVREHVR